MGSSTREIEQRHAVKPGHYKDAALFNFLLYFSIVILNFFISNNNSVHKTVLCYRSTRV